MGGLLHHWTADAQVDVENGAFDRKTNCRYCVGDGHFKTRSLIFNPVESLVKYIEERDDTLTMKFPIDQSRSPTMCAKQY